VVPLYCCLGEKGVPKLVSFVVSDDKASIIISDVGFYYVFCYIVVSSGAFDCTLS